MVSLSIAISRSPLLGSQFFKKDVSQMVQRFPELQRIDQGLTRPVIPIQLVQILAGDQKRGNPSAIVADPHITQITAVAQKERSSEDVRRLKAVGFQASHLLSVLDFFWKIR
jgi:hypothetical protein